jgi:23S rRNA (guanine745-N1)-methyltransferase
MLADVVGCLMCPSCGADLAIAAGTLACANGHSFDVARQGYVNLLPGDARPGTADTREMVRAREEFLATGCFAPLARAVADAVAAAGVPDGCIVETGAGTAYYLAAVLDEMPGRVGLALDLSKHAARSAARANSRIGAAVCDAWGTLPVRTGAASALLDVFAPRNASEFRRVLAPGGALIVVTPTSRHLGELVAVLGLVTVDADKPHRLDEKLRRDFRADGSAPVEQVCELTRADVASLVAMGPSARHIDAGTLADAIAALPEPYPVTLSVTVSTYRPLTFGREG